MSASFINLPTDGDPSHRGIRKMNHKGSYCFICRHKNTEEKLTIPQCLHNQAALVDRLLCDDETIQAMFDRYLNEIKSVNICKSHAPGYQYEKGRRYGPSRRTSEYHTWHKSQGGAQTSKLQKIQDHIRAGMEKETLTPVQPALRIVINKDPMTRVGIKRKQEFDSTLDSMNRKESYCCICRHKNTEEKLSIPQCMHNQAALIDRLLCDDETIQDIFNRYLNELKTVNICKSHAPGYQYEKGRKYGPSRRSQTTQRPRDETQSSKLQEMEDCLRAELKIEIEATSSGQPSVNIEEQKKMPLPEVTVESKQDLVVKLDFTTNDSDGKVVCPIEGCGASLARKHINDHLFMKHAFSKAQIFAIRQEEKPFQCAFCPKSCKSQDGLEQHMRKNHDTAKKKVKCLFNECEEFCGSNSNLSHHLLEDHPADIVGTAEVVRMRFDSEDKFKEWKRCVGEAYSTHFRTDSNHRCKMGRNHRLLCAQSGVRERMGKGIRNGRVMTRTVDRCSAYLAVNVYDNGVIDVNGFLGHVGHELASPSRKMSDKEVAILQEKLQGFTSLSPLFDDVLTDASTLSTASLFRNVKEELVDLSESEDSSPISTEDQFHILDILPKNEALNGKVEVKMEITDDEPSSSGTFTFNMTGDPSGKQHSTPHPLLMERVKQEIEVKEELVETKALTLDVDPQSLTASRRALSKRTEPSLRLQISPNRGTPAKKNVEYNPMRAKYELIGMVRKHNVIWDDSNPDSVERRAQDAPAAWKAISEEMSTLFGVCISVEICQELWTDIRRKFNWQKNAKNNNAPRMMEQTKKIDVPSNQLFFCNICTENFPENEMHSLKNVHTAFDVERTLGCAPRLTDRFKHLKTVWICRKHMEDYEKEKKQRLEILDTADDHFVSNVIDSLKTRSDDSKDVVKCEPSEPSLSNV